MLGSGPASGNESEDGLATERRAARRNYRVIFAVLVAAVIGYSLLQSLVVPVLPTIQADLHTSQANATWILTIYLLSASVCTPIVGRLGDVWGKQRLLMVALAGMAAGCGLSAIAGSIWLMLLGRAIQGIGGGVLPLAFGMIREEFPRAKVAGAVGATAAVAAAGSGAGLVLAGPIVGAVSYRWLFWIPMVALLVAAVAVKFVVPASVATGVGGVSWRGAALLSLWLVLLLVPLSEGPQWGWTSPQVVGTLVAAALFACVWGVVERRSKHPLIDMQMMRLPVVWTANLVALLFGVGLYAILAFLPQFLETPSSAGYGFGMTITEAGLVLSPLAGVMFVVGILCGRLTTRFGGKALLVAGSVASVIPFVVLATYRSQLWAIVGALAILGCGFGLAYSAMSSLIVEGVALDQTGVASGMNANIRTIGGSIGVAAMTSVVTATAHGTGLPTNAGYTKGFVLLCIAAIGAAGASFLVPSRLAAPTSAELEEALPHPELGMVAGGTVLGDLPE